MGRGQQYRPDYSRRDSPPPPPTPDMPPLPWGPPPSSRPFEFGAGSSQMEYTDSNWMQQSEFSFRANDHAPQFPHHVDTYRPSYADAQRDAQNEYRSSHASGHTREDQHRRSGHARRGDRGHWGAYRARPTFHPSSRPLLLASGGDSPKRNLETSGSPIEAQRFRNADDLSDSDEAVMNESDSQSNASLMVADTEEYEPSFEWNGLSTLMGMQSNHDHTGDGSLQAPTSAMETSASAISSKSESVPPKWSNPEYFTVLPPPDDSLRKKKDVVKLIRKARVALTKTDERESEVVANDDFISLDFDEVQSDTDVKMGKALGKSLGQGTPGAPLGPSQPNGHGFRHGRPLTVAPGTEHSALTASQLGPPPANHPPSIRTATTIETVAVRQKRKRDSDEEDDALIPRPPKKAKGRGVFSNGRILDEWRISHTKNPVPWLSIGSQMPTENPGLRLHQEICDFYSFVKPQEYEHIIRTDTLNRIRDAIKRYDPECDLRCFGSFAAGLYLPNADMDLVIVSRKFMGTGKPSVFQSTSSMHNLGSYLKRHGIAEIDSLEVVSKAKVPIVKFVDQITNLKVDISFENDSGLIANDTFQRWREEYPAMPILVTLTKQFLMMRGLNEVAQGGIGGFSVTCLVVSLLQNLPRVQCGELVPEKHLGEMLLEFLDFYGNQLDISQTGLSMEPPGYFTKQYSANKFDRLAIMDPNNPNNDISGGSRHIRIVFAAFAECHHEILRAMRTPGNKSLLGWMLGGNYSSILWQRQRLRRLYKDNYGPRAHGGSSVKNALQQGSHYPGSKPNRGCSDAERIENSKPGPEGASSLFWADQIKELKGIAQSHHMVEYARTATTSEHRALHLSILEKEKNLLKELKHQEAIRDSQKVASKKAKRNREIEEPEIRLESTHVIRRRIIKTWNPSDVTLGIKMKSKTLENARETYRRFYTLLQSILDANPWPGWQETAFGKTSKAQLSTRNKLEVTKPEGDLTMGKQESDKVSTKQESQTILLGSLEEYLRKSPDGDVARSQSGNASLTRQGSSTQDAIMID